jgi:hypothetical protein
MKNKILKGDYNMIKEVKNFCKKYKKELIVGGLIIVGGGVIGSIAQQIISKKKGFTVPDGMTTIYWKPNNSFINLEKVKEVLDLNVNNNESFAIFREGPNSEAYTLVLLSDNVVTDA